MTERREGKYAPSECGRCGREFVCSSGTPALCACFHIRLSPSETQHIAEICDGECVCPDCLLEIRENLRQAPRRDTIKE